MAVALPRCHGVFVPEMHFDERIARRYEMFWPGLFDPECSIRRWTSSPSAALELGIGGPYAVHE